MTQKKLNKREQIEAWITREQKWIKECGGDLAGYIANYHGKRGRTIENATDIYEADVAVLKKYQERLVAFDAIPRVKTFAQRYPGVNENTICDRFPGCHSGHCGQNLYTAQDFLKDACLVLDGSNSNSHVVSTLTEILETYFPKDIAAARRARDEAAKACV